MLNKRQVHCGQKIKAGEVIHSTFTKGIDAWINFFHWICERKFW